MDIAALFTSTVSDAHDTARPGQLSNTRFGEHGAATARSASRVAGPEASQRAASVTGDGALRLVRGQGFCRQVHRGDFDLLLDHFAEGRVACAALRFPTPGGEQRVLSLSGGYRVKSAAAGGWLLTPARQGVYAYWIPRAPVVRRLDKDGHILSHRTADVSGLEASADGLQVTLDHPVGHVLDLVIWRLPANDESTRALMQLSSLERQRYFLWSSHTAYARPADLYLHWVHGHIYENHEVWPKYWRVCSELDAYALYVVLTGLWRATRKPLYDWLRTQVVFSVIDRQSNDGGWYHGEWTDEMESHFRLHAAGVHLLAAHYEESHDPVVRVALEKAAAFAASKKDHLHSGAWYLHDSLEETCEGLRRYPFKCLPSRALGKSESNLLVLNTHLDTNIAMVRYRQVTGDARYDGLVQSAADSTRAVLGLRPAEWLYRPLFRAVALTFLPAERARTLPLHLRAIKRIAWRHLIPWLPRIKRWRPRLVMPGGYIERELSMQAFSVRYQPVNLMDLARTRRALDDRSLDTLLTESFAFTNACGLVDRWKALKGKEDDSLGFWAEALYHLALARPDARYREWLAQAMLHLEDNGLGLPPSLLGSNAEAVGSTEQHPCPMPADDRLRVANLSCSGSTEWLVVNPSDRPIELRWATAPPAAVDWRTPSGTPAVDVLPVLAPRAWLWGRKQQAEAA